MSWASFNSLTDGLKNVKGKLTDLAESVLTEIDGGAVQDKDDANESVKDARGAVVTKSDQNNDSNEFIDDQNWDWSTSEQETDQFKTAEFISNLKSRIAELENENRDLHENLQQLDQNHQQNLEQILAIKDKISEELKDVKAKYEAKHLYNEQEVQTMDNDRIFVSMEKIIEQNISDSTKLALQTENQEFVKEYLTKNHHNLMTTIKYIKTCFISDNQTFEINGDLHEILKKLSELKNELNLLEKQISNDEEQPISIQSDSSEPTIEEQIVVVPSDRDILNETVEKQMEEIKSLKIKLSSCTESNNSLTDQVVKLEDLKLKHEAIQEENKVLQDSHQQTLNMCEQYKNRIGEMTEEHKSLNDKLSLCMETNKSLTEQIVKLEKAATECNILKDEAKSQHIVLKTNLEDLQQHYNAIKEENKAILKEFEVLQDSYKQTLDICEKYKNQINEMENGMLKSKKTIAELENSMAVLKNQNTDLENKFKDMEDKCKLLELQENCINLQETSKTEEIKNLREENILLNKKLSSSMETKKILTEQIVKLEEAAAQFNNLKDEAKSQQIVLKTSFEDLQQQYNVIKDENKAMLKELEVLRDSHHETNSNEQIETLKKDIVDKIDLLETTKAEKLQLYSKCQELEVQLQGVIQSREELIAMVQTKHQENISYHQEIQRLSDLLKEKSDRNVDEELNNLLEKNEFLRKKCEVFAENVMKDQELNQKLTNEVKFLKNKCIEAGRLETDKSNLSKQVERLQSHLIEMQDHYTDELLRSEEKNAALEAKLREIEQREKECSTIYTSVSIRANQQVEALQQQLQQATTQKELLEKKLVDVEEENRKKSSELNNLQVVLQQFQKDKQCDVSKETFRITRQIKEERKVQDELRNEIKTLKSQLEESKQGLQAASRLTDQLQTAKGQISTLKKQVITLEEMNSKNEEKMKNILGDVDGKVDKNLIKNLVVGFLSTTKNLTQDQGQILKIIATILDFNQQDHEKIRRLNEGSWLDALLAPGQGHKEPQESLTGAFVRFLEKESKPEEIPNLPQSYTPSSDGTKKTTNSPVVLNQMNLPVFADYAQRNSSSILKDVLKDN